MTSVAHRAGRWVLMPLLWAALVGSATAAPVTMIRNNGSSANRVDIVVLGDGYTSTDIASGLYAQQVESFIQGLFAEDPSLEYQNFYNVWRVDVTSAESGVDHPELGVFKNTALDAAYNCAGIQRLICVDTTKVNAVLSSSGVAANARDVVLVIVNDSTYGGSGGSVAVASTHQEAVEIIRHGKTRDPIAAECTRSGLMRMDSRSGQQMASLSVPRHSFLARCSEGR